MALTLAKGSSPEELERTGNDSSDAAGEILDAYDEDGRKLRPRLLEIKYVELDESNGFSDDADSSRMESSTSDSDENSGSGPITIDLESSSEESDDGDDKAIMIGPDFQADIPEGVLSEYERSNYDLVDTSVCTWKPVENMSDRKVHEFVKKALTIEKHEGCQFSVEQVLGILYKCKHDPVAAIWLLKELNPIDNGWSFEEKIVFEQALDKHGKNFRRIVEDMFPGRCIGSVIQLYYDRKAWTKKLKRKEEELSSLQENLPPPKQAKSDSSSATTPSSELLPIKSKDVEKKLPAPGPSRKRCILPSELTEKLRMFSEQNKDRYILGIKK